jgi:hypothetical protein
MCFCYVSGDIFMVFGLTSSFFFFFLFCLFIKLYFYVTLLCWWCWREKIYIYVYIYIFLMSHCYIIKYMLFNYNIMILFAIIMLFDDRLVVYDILFLFYFYFINVMLCFCFDVFIMVWHLRVLYLLNFW